MKDTSFSTEYARHHTPQQLWSIGCLSLCLVLLAVSCSFGQGKVLLMDNFKGKKLDNWTIIDAGDSKPKSEWVKGGNKFIQLANTAANDPKTSGTYAITGDPSWTDYAFTVKMTSEDNDGLGVMFRYTDPNNYYRFRWTGEGSNWNGKILEKCVDGKWSVQASDKAGYKPFREYLIGVALAGNRIKLYIDDTTKPVFDVVDSENALTKGKIGLYSWDNAGSSFARLCVATNDYPFPPAESRAPGLEVSGLVFDDRNGNGRQDASEKGLGGVRISDGYTIIRTYKDGSYKIESVDRSRSKFVFVVTPSGRRASGSFYMALPDEGTQYKADFPLTPSAESANRHFSFAQITDLHVAGDAGPLVEDLIEIAGFKPSFIIATGDLVNDGRKISQLETYKAGIEKSPVPVINLPGNHDGGGDPVNYEELFGPDYYSFDYGGCHFVMFNSCDESETQKQWLKKDLEEAKGTPVMFFQHYHPSTELMKMLNQHKTIGVFSGHWHTTKAFPYAPADNSKKKSTTLYVNSPPLSMGGIDVSPRGFVVAHVDHGKLTIEHRHGGVKQKTAIAAPADGSTVAAGDVDIQIIAYDSASPRVKVEYRINDGPWRQARQSSSMTWSTRERLSAGSYELRTRCTFGDGNPIESHIHFTASSDLKATPTPGDDWPMLRHDASHTGVSTDTVTPPLRLAWSNSLSGSAHGASPVVAGETVYVGIADEDCKGRAGVYAVDIRSGEVRWSYHTLGSIRNSVAVDNGAVYAVSVAGEVVALDAASGKPRFTHNMNGVDRWLFSSPVVKDGVLYAGSGAEFLALDAKTGKQIWTSERMGHDWISCLTSPAVSSSKVFMGLNWSTGLFGLNRRTGKIVWNNKEGYGTTHGTPAIVDGRVYHAANNKLYCANASDGSNIWSFDLPGCWTLSSPVVSDGRVFVGGPDGNMYCVDASNGKPIWNTPTGKQILCFAPYERSGNPFVASPVVSGKVVYCGSGDGKLYAYNADDGKVLWTYDLGVPITASPAISGNSLFITTFDGMVCAFVEES